MIGDFILWLKQIFKETFCVHVYKTKGTYGLYDSHGYLKCEKCGRLKDIQFSVIMVIKMDKETKEIAEEVEEAFEIMFEDREEL